MARFRRERDARNSISKEWLRGEPIVNPLEVGSCECNCVREPRACDLQAAEQEGLATSGWIGGRARRGERMKHANNDLFVIGSIAVLSALLATALTFPFPSGMREESGESTPWVRKMGASDTISSVDGKAIFAKNCVSCHGEEGRKPIIGVPTLNQPRMLSVAADKYYETIITHGRPGSSMPAWDSMFTPNQIQSLVAYIRSWYPKEPDRSKISAARGNAVYGASMFRNNCAGCHGQHGEGGIGNSLRSPSFLALASEHFLRETIIEGRGRGNTAMPTGYTYSPEELSDVLAYLATWKAPEHDFAQVDALLARSGPTNTDYGASIFRARCAACHGDEGEGGIGSRLNSQSFLTAVDDRFFYRSITEGRPGTAMPSWGFLDAEDIADVISHMRSWQQGPARSLPKRQEKGDPVSGAEIYAAVCLSCHGDHGQGGLGGQLANSVFLDCAEDEFLWDTIAHGKTGTAMRGFLKGTPGGALVALQEEEIDDLVAYLHSLETEQLSDPPKRPLSRRAELVGKMVYEEIGGCAACHGKSGEGGSGPALRNPEFLRVASDGFLIGTIVLGREQSAMLSFSHGGVSNLNADQIESVASYIRSFEDKPFAGRPRTDQTPSNIAAGQELFVSNCASCHGSDGRGLTNNERLDGIAPSLNNPAFLSAANDGLILATIAMGRPGTAMKPFARHSGGIAELSGDEILNILAFIRSWQSSEEPK